MSIEMHVFLSRANIPDRSSWQSAIDSLGLPFELDPELDISRDQGFSPGKIKGIASGFEIYSEQASEVLDSYPDVIAAVKERDWCISFRWGGDMKECACALAATAGLVKSSDAVAYYPDGNMICDLKSLLDDGQAALAED